MTNEIQIYETKNQRTKCPFYGFAYAMGVLMDSKGNQCALITSSYSPCRMEISGQEICWSDCGFNKEKHTSTIENILDSATIFPDELMPKGASSWKGIPLRKWYEHIVNGKNI